MRRHGAGNRRPYVPSERRRIRPASSDGWERKPVRRRFSSTLTQPALLLPRSSVTSMTTSQFFFSTTTLVDQLNRHWRDGGLPTNQRRPRASSTARGSIMSPDSRTPPMPPPPKFWESFGRPNRALPYGDRMSASLLSRHTPNVYSPFNIRVLRQANFSYLPGVILDASIARPRLSCCYPFDPVSVSVRCAQFGGDATCTPGCAFAESAPSYTKRLTRAHRPADLATCMLGRRRAPASGRGAKRAGIRAKSTMSSSPTSRRVERARRRGRRHLPRAARGKQRSASRARCATCRGCRSATVGARRDAVFGARRRRQRTHTAPTLL